jgi:hypothetical protein
MHPSVGVLNEAFQVAYRLATKERQATAPIFILIGDELVVYNRDARRAHVVKPDAYHVLKTVSHAPLAMYALSKTREPALDAAAMLQSRIEETRLEELTGAARADCEFVLRETAEAIDLYLGRRLDVGAFTQRMGDALRRLRWHATALHMAELDRHVEAELARMNQDERSLLQVVVAGVHQARDRSLGTLYFQRRLPAGCPAGERVLYGEGVRTEQSALELVSLQRFDREIAAAFFGDPAKLQQDILGDAAEEIIAARFRRPEG